MTLHNIKYLPLLDKMCYWQRIMLVHVITLLTFLEMFIVLTFMFLRRVFLSFRRLYGKNTQTLIYKILMLIYVSITIWSNENNIYHKVHRHYRKVPASSSALPKLLLPWAGLVVVGVVVEGGHVADVVLLWSVTCSWRESVRNCGQ